jgi:hypothetical protein
MVELRLAMLMVGLVFAYTFVVFAIAYALRNK